MLIHIHCGGEVGPAWNEEPYESEEYGTVPVYRCKRCMKEIVGDAQIEIVGNECDE